MNSHVVAQIAWVIITLASLESVDITQAEDLLVNGSFAKHDDGLPTDWSIRKNQQQVSIDATEAHHPDVDQALRVDILCDGGSSYGEIAQAVSVQPNMVYRFSGDWRSSKGQTAFFQIKLIKDRTELERIHLGWSEQAWQRVVRYVHSGEADEIEVICRYRQKKDFVGIVCWYTNLSLKPIAGNTRTEDSITVISKPIAPPPFKTPSFDFPAENPDLRVAAPGTDQYVTPVGAGNRSGTDWENARPAQDGGLQAIYELARYVSTRKK